MGRPGESRSPNPKRRAPKNRARAAEGAGRPAPEVASHAGAAARPSDTLEAIGAGHWELDAEARTLRLSPAAQRLLGTPAAEVPVDRLADLVEDGQGLAGAIATAARAGHGSIDHDVRVLRPDGQARWLQLVGTIEPDAASGDGRGSGIALDITERKRLEQRLGIAEAVSRIIARCDTLDEAIPGVLAAMADTLDCEIGTLWQPTPDGATLTCARVHVGSGARGFDRFVRRSRETRLAAGEGPFGHAARTRSATSLSSDQGGAGWDRMREALDAGLLDGAAIPLLAGSVSVGIIEVLGTRPIAWDEPLRATLTRLGSDVGQFVLHTRAETRLRASGARQRLLVAILQAHRDAVDAGEVMRASTEALGRHLGVMRVGFVERFDDRIDFLAGWADRPDRALGGSWPLDGLGEAYLEELAKGRPVSIPDIETDRLSRGSRLRDMGIRSTISVPIVRGGRWSAVMYVHDDVPRTWSRSEIQLAREVADHTWDAVERLRAEAARRASEALAQTIADSSSQALLMLDEAGCVQYANAACLEMFGFLGEEVRARPFHDLVHHHHPDGRPYPRAECPIDQARPAGSIISEREEVYFRKDGRAFPVLVAAIPVYRRGQPDSTIVEIRDVSATQEAATALAASERRFRGTFENAAVGVAHVGLDGRWLRVNRRLCEITGYPEAELRALTFQDITHPDDLAEDLARVDALLRGEIDTYTLEKRYRRRDDSDLWVELTVSLERDDDGRPEYLIAVVTDIATRKSAEERLRMALEVKDQFLGLVSHELRTPMTIILGMSEVLASRDITHERARAIAADIAASAGELHELIESMLLLSRLDRDEASMHEPALLTRVAEDAVERQRSQDRSRRYLLEAPSSVIVDVSPGLLQRVISNLLANAAKYSTPEGDVRLSIAEDGHEVSLRVLDSGPGLSDAELAQVFEPFYRTRAAMASPGAGLGLAVAQRIVHSLGGRVWAARRGEGSEFGFALPRLEPEED